MEEKNQQGMSLSAEKMFEKVGRLVMVNEELSEMLAKTKEQWQLTINENEKLKKEIEEFKAINSTRKMKVVSEN